MKPLIIAATMVAAFILAVPFAHPSGAHAWACEGAAGTLNTNSNQLGVVGQTIDHNLPLAIGAQSYCEAEGAVVFTLCLTGPVSYCLPSWGQNGHFATHTFIIPPPLPLGTYTFQVYVYGVPLLEEYDFFTVV